MNIGPEKLTHAVAAVCSVGERGGCKWYSGSDTEDQVQADAEDHARACPGHLIQVQVQMSRTWAVYEPPGELIP